MKLSKYAMGDLDHPLWVILSGAFVTMVTGICLYANYNHWEAPKDLATMGTVASAYFVSALGKRIVRMKQRAQREENQP